MMVAQGAPTSARRIARRDLFGSFLDRAKNEHPLHERKHEYVPQFAVSGEREVPAD
jgi:hypothetical protein